MKKLIFKLISDKKTIIDEYVSYFISNNSINFKIEDTLYKYSINDDIFYKTDNELSLKIDLNNSIIFVKLIENGLVFNMNIDKIKILKKNNEIYIKYMLISDEKIENEIIIKY